MTAVAEPEVVTIASDTPVTPTENLITLLGGVWLTFGLFIDGYAHSNIINTATEDFFTPWHGIFYSGFAFSAAWIAWLMYRRQNPNGIRAWIPPGYGWAVVGLVAFGIGGIGDGIWHTIFGIEVNIDALLSPTHMLLLFGLILILAAPMQSAISSGGSVWVAATSLGILGSLAAFFTAYGRVISNAWALEITFDPPANDSNYLWIEWAVIGSIATTLILVVTALYLIQRFDRIPFGAITLLWAIPTTLEAYALSSTQGPAIAAALVGGGTADVLYRLLDGDTRRRAIAAFPLGIAVLWSSWLGISRVAGYEIGWAPEVWSGMIILSMLVAAGLVMLATPPERTNHR